MDTRCHTQVQTAHGIELSSIHMNPQHMIDTPTQQALLAILVHAAMADGEKSQAERDFVRDLSL